METRYVAYYRVREDYDLREQHDCVKEHVRSAGGLVLRSYRDIETSPRPERPGFHRAVLYAKRNAASMILGTLRGLSRDVAFLRLLRDSGVTFVACDMPQANHATIHVLTALAEYDAQVASDRTKRALAAYKARGGKLGAARPGARNLDAEARIRGARSAGLIAKLQADEAYRELAPLIRKLRSQGLTLQEVADRLNELGSHTRRGKPWNAMQVSRVLKRKRNGNSQASA